jgi:hypothetical protein
MVKIIAEWIDQQDDKTFSQHAYDNGMHGGEVRDAYGMIESATTAGTSGEVKEWIYNKKQNASIEAMEQRHARLQGRAHDKN